MSQPNPTLLLRMPPPKPAVPPPPPPPPGIPGHVFSPLKRGVDGQILGWLSYGRHTPRVDEVMPAPVADRFSWIWDLGFRAWRVQGLGLGFKALGSGELPGSWVVFL